VRARLRIARAVALLALFGLGCRSRGAAQAHPAKPAASVAHAPLSTDPELAAAERAAIARLPEFRAVLTRAEPTNQAFEVEAVVKDGALSERLWLGDVKAVAGGFEGSVSSEPKQLKSIHRAQSLRVADEDVVDWAYYERRTLHGAETRRIALEQRRRAELADALTHCREAKFADGCAALGDTYAAGVLFERRPEVALELYTKACAGGSTYGCNAAGWAVFHGRGGAQDLPAAAAFFALPATSIRSAATRVASRC